MEKEIWSLEEISKRISVLTGAEISTVSDFIKGIISLVPEVLKSEREVYLSEIGKFSITQQNNEEIKFEPSKKLAESVNQFFSSFEITELDDNFPDIKGNQNSQGSEISDTRSIKSNMIDNDQQKKIMKPQHNQGYPQQNGYPDTDPYSVPPVYPPSYIPPTPTSEHSHINPPEDRYQTGNNTFRQSQNHYPPEVSKHYYQPQRETTYDYPPNQSPRHTDKNHLGVKYEKEREYHNTSRGTGSNAIWIALFALSVGFMAGFFLRPIIFPWSNEPPVTMQYNNSHESSNNDSKESVISEPSIFTDQKEIDNGITTTEEPEIITETITKGTYLTNLSRKYYGHPDFWVYIYEENRNKILDPDNVPVGTVLVIPPKEKYNIDPDSKESRTRAKNLAYEIYHR